jgi:hypothetical protein
VKTYQGSPQGGSALSELSKKCHMRSRGQQVEILCAAIGAVAAASFIHLIEMVLRR